MAVEGHPGRAAPWLILAGASLALLGLFLARAPIATLFVLERIDRVDPAAPRGRIAPHRVLLVSIDGLAPWVLAGTPTPTLDRLAVEGVSTLRARNVLPSVTLVNHTSMVSGVSSEVHGVEWNDYRPWRKIQAPTVFSFCRLEGLRCALMAGKKKLLHLADEEPGVERWFLGDDSTEVFALAAAYAAERDPDFLMVHVADVDKAGHDEGWGSPAQRRALAAVDAELGRFLERLRDGTRPLRLLVSADHGGYDHHHREVRPETVTIPWIAWGAGIIPRRLEDDVSVLDTAPTILSWLDIRVPESWPGRVRAE